MDIAHEKFSPSLAVMIQDIRNDLERTAYLTGVEKLSPQVLKALQKTPRHYFVPSWETEDAYRNAALAIGEGQTISQPFIVALMTELLNVQPSDKILEVGTGSGYQAAILAHLAKRVYTIEIFPSLADEARKKLHNLGYKNVSVFIVDGNKGLAEHGPYDKIIVTAAAPKIPEQLIKQLAPYGCMVLPVGSVDQQLVLIQKDGQGNITQKAVLSVVFVPLLKKTHLGNSSKDKLP